MAVRSVRSLLIIQLAFFFCACSVAIGATAQRDATPSPIVIAASQDWEGIDGSWSTFTIQVGTPPQVKNVFVGTSVYHNLVVAPEGCVATDPAKCGDMRGGIFNLSESTTWSKNMANSSGNIYLMNVDNAQGYTGAAEFGFDVVTLGWPGAGGPTLNNISVGAIASKDTYLGQFGLCPRPTNFSSWDNPTLSHMETLYNKSMIPSLTWAYTAGNQYRLDKALGSLTLGGYDASKFTPSNITWPFNAIDIRDLTVQIESITTTTATNKMPTSLLPSPITAFLDSSLPYLWLPAEACALFEETFNLVWDNLTELYLVNGAPHNTLLALDPSITFTLGSLTSESQVNITLPYSAFDLTATTYIVLNQSYYFPLKRATNDTQYVLGQTFFQEAYVIADYERHEFSVSPCKWEGNATQDIVTIYPPTSFSSNSTNTRTSPTILTSTNTISNSDADSNSPEHLGLILGSIFAAILIFISLVVFYNLCIKPRRRAEAAKNKAEGLRWKASTPPMLARRWESLWGIGAEMDNQDEGRKYEKDGGKNQWVVESDMREREVFELPAREEVACELRAEGGVEIGTESEGLRGLGIDSIQERSGSEQGLLRPKRLGRVVGGRNKALPPIVPHKNVVPIIHDDVALGGMI